MIKKPLKHRLTETNCSFFVEFYNKQKYLHFSCLTFISFNLQANKNAFVNKMKMFIRLVINSDPNFLICSYGWNFIPYIFEIERKNNQLNMALNENV